RLPAGDGMALVFFDSPEAPVQCAMEISEALKAYPQLELRMGVHSGPVSGLTDVNDRSNAAGAGINTAQRVMDCGDAGHILLSQHAAEDLEQYDQWQPYLHDLGECEIKHGERLHLVNFYNHEVGNSARPIKFAPPAGVAPGATAQANRRRYSLVAMAIGALIVVGATVLFFTARTTFRTATGRTETASVSTPPIQEKSIAVL